MNSRKNWIVYLPGQELSFLDVEATVVDGLLYIKDDEVRAVFTLANIRGFREKHNNEKVKYNDYCSDMLDALERSRERFCRQWGIYETKGE